MSFSINRQGYSGPMTRSRTRALAHQNRNPETTTQRASQAATRAANFMKMPTELQMMVLENLNWRDLAEASVTCSHVRELAREIENRRTPELKERDLDFGRMLRMTLRLQRSGYLPVVNPYPFIARHISILANRRNSHVHTLYLRSVPLGTTPGRYLDRLLPTCEKVCVIMYHRPLEWRHMQQLMTDPSFNWDEPTEEGPEPLAVTEEDNQRMREFFNRGVIQFTSIRDNPVLAEPENSSFQALLQDNPQEADHYLDELAERGLNRPSHDESPLVRYWHQSWGAPPDDGQDRAMIPYRIDRTGVGNN